MIYEPSQIDGAKAAAAVRGQGLFCAGIGAGNGLAIGQVIVAIDVVQEQYARLGMVVGGPHDLIPQLARLQLSVNPQATVFCLVGARFFLACARLGAMNQSELAILLHSFHESVADTDGNIEVLQVSRVLGMNEFFNIGMVAT